MKYKYCILAAGSGHRNFFSKSSHKALLPLNNRSVLSLLFEKMDPKIPILMVIGHNGQLLKEYIQLVHSDRDVTFIEVDKFEGPGSGPGYSLLVCKSELMCPFVLLNCDSYIERQVPVPDENWMGVSKVSVPEPYCLLGVREELVETLFDKQNYRQIAESSYDPDDALNNAFIGIAGIHDFKEFWDGLEFNTTQKAGELQVSNGFEELLNKNLTVKRFSKWLDTGTDESYLKALEEVGKNQVLLKPDEFIYIENNFVIKFFVDAEIITRRVYRADKLKGIVPEITQHTKNFYTYRFIPGITLGDETDFRVFQNLFKQFKPLLFKQIDLTDSQNKLFLQDCHEFYYDKTLKRIKTFYQARSIEDQQHHINGITVPKLSELLDQVDWKNLAQGIPVLFHGDFQPENIIVDGGDITLIDWRQDFNGEVNYGDVYYDFAKMYHALQLSAEVIREKNFEVHLHNNIVKFRYLIKSNLLEFLHLFEKFLTSHDYDLQKVRVLTALIYLNIAPLHHSPYSELLYFLGKRFLFTTLNPTERMKL